MKLERFPEDLKADFRPLRHLGAGGMGLVFLAEDAGLGRQVAVKILGGVTDGNAVERFLREARALARIEHPNVVRIYSSGTCSRGPYIAMEYLDGEALQEVDRKLDLIPLFLDVAAGLEAVHTAGLIHRDVKPANIVLTGDGRPVLVDFGLARDGESPALTRTGALVGTLGFLAPEVIRGDPATPAADWFGWGVSLHVVAEGTMPYSTEDLWRMSRGEETPPPTYRNLPPGSPLTALLGRALSLDPSGRPASVEEIRELLENAGPLPRVPSRSIETEVLRELTGTGTRTTPPPRRPRRWSLILPWLLVAVGMAFWTLRAPGPASPHAEDVAREIEVRARAERRRALEEAARRAESVERELEWLQPLVKDSRRRLELGPTEVERIEELMSRWRDLLDAAERWRRLEHEHDPHLSGADRTAAGSTEAAVQVLGLPARFLGRMTLFRQALEETFLTRMDIGSESPPLRIMKLIERTLRETGKRECHDDAWPGDSLHLLAFRAGLLHSRLLFEGAPERIPVLISVLLRLDAVLEEDPPGHLAPVLEKVARELLRLLLKVSSRPHDPEVRDLLERASRRVRRRLAGKGPEMEMAEYLVLVHLHAAFLSKPSRPVLPVDPALYRLKEMAERLLSLPVELRSRRFRNSLDSTCFFFGKGKEGLAARCRDILRPLCEVADAMSAEAARRRAEPAR